MDNPTTVLPAETEPKAKDRQTIQFRVTAEEYAIFESLAAAQHLKIGTYIKHFVLSNNVKSIEKSRETA